MHNKSEKEYHYQNLSLDNIEGEQWEDIPGLDGYVLISDLGRIKRQQYEIQYPNGSICVRPEKIIKPRFDKAINKFRNDYTYYLIGKVVIEGRSFAFSVPRMVYYCFVEPFDLEDTSIVILCKNTDNLNIHPSNLMLATRDQKVQRAVERQRFRSPLLDLAEEQRAAIRKSIIETLRKQVTQFTLQGHKIKTYESLADATRATGVLANAVGRVASGEATSAGGFIWGWGNQEKVDEGLKEDRRKKKRGQRVTQYELSGKKIVEYPSIQEAAEATGVHYTGINMVLRGKYGSSKGFYWIKGYGDDFINLLQHMKKNQQQDQAK